MPILRPFQPLQATHLTSSEDNRQKSIARMNMGSSKPKKRIRQPAKAAAEPLVSPPVKDVSIILLPLNVLGFSPSHLLAGMTLRLHPFYRYDPTPMML